MEIIIEGECQKYHTINFNTSKDAKINKKIVMKKFVLNSSDSI